MPPQFTAHTPVLKPKRTGSESPAPSRCRSGAASPAPRSGYASPASGCASPRATDLASEKDGGDDCPWYLNGEFDDSSAGGLSKTWSSSNPPAGRRYSGRKGQTEATSFSIDYMGRAMNPGDAVTVLRTLYKTQGEDLQVCTGWRGIISKVDEDGDILVDFGGNKPLRWVRSKHLGSLRRADMDELSGISRKEWASRESSVVPSPCATPQRSQSRSSVPPVREKAVPRIQPLKEDSCKVKVVEKSRSFPADAGIPSRGPSSSTLPGAASWTPTEREPRTSAPASRTTGCTAGLRRFPRFASCFVRPVT